MVIIKPLKALVCLAVLISFILQPEAGAYTAPDLSGVPGIQGDALSADPKPPQSVQQLRSRPKYTEPTYTSKPISTRSHSKGYYGSSGDPGPVSVAPNFPAVSPNALGVPGSAYCPPNQPCPPASSGYGLFTQGVPIGYGGFLPRIGAKQFQVAARLWYAKLNSSKIVWGTAPGGVSGTQLDLHNDLGLSNHEYIAEYEARCQIRCNWGLRFTFMPIEFRDNFTPTFPFFFGNILYLANINSLTEWHRNIYRWDLVYDWYQRAHAVSSIFAGYSLYDDKLTVGQPFVFPGSRTRSQGFGLAHAGISIERVIKNLNCSGATASLNCKWSAQFLEGYFGWDGYAAGRIAVPMQSGRFGYVEAGWRWIVLERDYPSNADNTNLDGVTGTVGLIF
ncbi:MAG TPA: hypothetical protein VK463_18960 [Desulfomonilaceae bacterium]|nr:hypothetical protein [Desulfomonilaceae bacterium]